jgi:cyclic pyranopterin phosphate synthase
MTNTKEGSLSNSLCDPFGRRLNNLRISITQKCNLHCFFCHREGEVFPNHEMTVEEISRVTQIACELGLREVKITGGEPLLRSDIAQIVANIAPYAHEISMTTNGVYLAKYAEILHGVGLTRVNISLHSISPSIYQKIAGFNGLSAVKEGLDAAIEHHLEPVKLNMVVLNGINVDEIPKMITFSRKRGLILQLIEFQPIQERSKAYWNRYYYDLSGVEKWLETHAISINKRSMHSRKQYHLVKNGQPTVVEVVKPIHNSAFCQNCTRLRVTSDGKLKPCLLKNDNMVDLLPLIRNGESDEKLREAFKFGVSMRAPYWIE